MATTTAASTRTKLLRLRNQAAGLCRCGQIPVPEKRRCQGCIDVESARNKVWRDKRLKAGLCICKAGNPIKPGTTRCEDCNKKGYQTTKRYTEKSTLKSPTLKMYLGWLARRHRKRIAKDHRNPLYRHFDLCGEDLVRIWESQNGLCALTGLTMLLMANSLESVSIDRKESTIGYVIDNVQLVCKWANLAKNKHSDIEFKAVLEKVRQQGATK